MWGFLRGISEACLEYMPRMYIPSQGSHKKSGTASTHLYQAKIYIKVCWGEMIILVKTTQLSFHTEWQKAMANHLYILLRKAIDSRQYG